MKKVVVALAFLLSPAVSGAIGFADADLHPLLRLNTSFFFLPTAVPVVLVGHMDGIKIVTRGGALISVETNQEDFSAPFRSQFLRGVGSPAATAKLKTKLGQYRIGLQTSCSLAPDSEVSGPQEITWYGRSGRRNAFTVYYGKAGLGFPACSPDVQEILNAIGEFQGTVFLDPDSERLTSD